MGHKRSFLDRVRNRRDSPKKQEKKDKTSTQISSVTVEELPSYDTSNLTQNRETETSSKEEEYLCPPPPRRVCSESLTATDFEELYDDIGAFQNRAKVEAYREAEAQRKAKTESCTKLTEGVETEPQHYQVPKANNRQVFEEELYDDIALSDSKARAKESTSSDKKIWCRLGSGKKNRGSDLDHQKPTVEAENCEDIDDRQIKIFQKLINRVENTLGKSAKTVLPSPSKSNGVT